MTFPLIGLLIVLLIMGLLVFSDYRANPKEPDPWLETIPEEDKAIAKSKNWESVARIVHRLSFIGFVVFMGNTVFAFTLPGMAGLMGFLTLMIATPCGLLCGTMSMLLAGRFQSQTKFEAWSGILAFAISALPALFFIFYILQNGF